VSTSRTKETHTPLEAHLSTEAFVSLQSVASRGPGLAEFAEEYPHYVEGKLPGAQEGADRVAPLELCQEALEKLSMSRSLRKSLDGRSVAGCSATSRATSRLAR
jgi:hypothetical protein